MNRVPVSHQTPELPPCDGCGEFDTGAYGFGPPCWPKVAHYCRDCAPSRTGAAGLPVRAVAATASIGQADLFGRAAA